MAGSSRNGAAFAAAIGLAVVISLLTVWTTIVRDDGAAAGNFMLILAAGVGCFAARFQPGGMARAMAGVAVMQALLGLLNATAPSTKAVAGEAIRALIFAGGFSLLWLAAAVLFSLAARSARTAA